MKSGQMTGFVAPYVQLMQGASPGPVIISAVSLIKFGELIQPWEIFSHLLVVLIKNMVNPSL